MFHFSVGCLVWELNGLRRPWCWLERTDIKCLSHIHHPVSLPIPKCWPNSIRNVITQATRLDGSARPTFARLYGDVFKPMMEAERNIDTQKLSETTTSSQVRFIENGTSDSNNNGDSVLAASSSSSNGIPRRGCLKATSRSLAVIQKALPSMVQMHRSSRCMCSGHANRDKQSGGGPEAEYTDLQQQRNHHHSNQKHHESSKEEITMNIQTVESKVVDSDVIGDIDYVMKMKQTKPTPPTTSPQVRN